MAYIKERGNNNYFVRVSCGILDNGRPFQKSRLFRPSRVNLPESKVRKELDAFVKALEEECRIEFETKRQPQTNFELSEDETKHESVEEQVNGDHQSRDTTYPEPVFRSKSRFSPRISAASSCAVADPYCGELSSINSPAQTVISPTL